MIKKRRRPRGLTPQEAEILALRSANVRLTRELKEANEIIKKGHWADPLTGLASRMRLEEEVHRHFGMNMHAERSGEPLAPFSLIFCDGNNFGQINKDYGHLVGDVMLKETADYLAASVRPGDIVARFAGDEFVILAPNTTIEQARHLMSKIYDGLKGFRFSSGPGTLSLSTGAASTSEGFTSLEGLLHTADIRMSARKKKSKVKG